MVYRKEWIEKNMGISGKTLRVYENRGLLKPARNPINGKYREYSEEDLERIWFIKLFVKLGYSLDEIEDMINASCFDFRESISRKIEKMEEEKGRLEQLIGYLKQIKETGLFPIFPQKMGDVKLMEFLDFFSQNWNINADLQSKISYQMVEYALSKSETEWSETDGIHMLEKIILKPESEWNEEDIDQLNELFGTVLKNMGGALIRDAYYKRLALLSNHDVSHPSVQSLVQKIYDFERNYLFSEFSDKITPQWYMEHTPAYFMDSDIAILNERKFGKENCEFIVKAIVYFGSHSQ